MITLGQLLMLVEYDKTVVLVQYGAYGTDEQICIFTQSEELEYTKEYEKVDKIVLQYEQRINELEEKEMTKYAKITKYLGPHNIDKRLGLEIGKTYKIVEYKSPLTDNCYIYLNDEYPYYFISERQYELVEKEETPTFKTTIDLKSSVQAKIDSLTTEAEHLFKKRDRLEQQANNLSKKAHKLNNLIESIKEFE